MLYLRIAVAALCALLCTQVHAYTHYNVEGAKGPVPMFWTPGSEIRFAISDSCNGFEDGILEAIQTWQNEIDAQAIDLTFVYEGWTDREHTGDDGTNILTCVYAGWTDNPNHEGMAAMAHPWPDNDGRLHGFDIRVNMEHIEWTDNLDESMRPGVMDIVRALTHELGHVLGLGHSEIQDAIMFGSDDNSQNNRDLTEDDQEGLNATWEHAQVQPKPSLEWRMEYGCATAPATNGGIPGASLAAILIVCIARRKRHYSTHNVRSRKKD